MPQLNEIKKPLNMKTTQRNKLVVYIVICMILNLIVMQYTPVGNARHLNGQSATQDEIADATIKTILIGIPLLGLILGTAISLFPYKGLTYSKKYFHFSLAIMLSLEILVFILSLITIIK